MNVCPCGAPCDDRHFGDCEGDVTAVEIFHQHFYSKPMELSVLHLCAGHAEVRGEAKQDLLSKPEVES